VFKRICMHASTAMTRGFFYGGWVGGWGGGY